jgi:hypothetical protein
MGAHAVLVMPLQAELSTYEAAELLGVSRPFLIRLFEKGELLLNDQLFK